MKNKKKKDDNPLMRMPWALVWTFCPLLALLISGDCEAYYKIQKHKEKIKAEKEAEFRRKYPEYYWWQDNQGL